jgi:hypothetical protein
MTGTVVVVNDPWRESSGSVLTDEFGTPKEQVLPTISQATEPPGTDTSGNRATASTMTQFASPMGLVACLRPSPTLR